LRAVATVPKATPTECRPDEVDGYLYTLRVAQHIMARYQVVLGNVPPCTLVASRESKAEQGQTTLKPTKFNFARLRRYQVQLVQLGNEGKPLNVINTC